MGKRILKKDSKTFVDNMVLGLELSLNAKPTKGLYDDQINYQLKTPLGNLNIRVETDNVYCYTVFSKFEDVETAKKKVGCNPHSGKYNFHIGNQLDPKGASDLVLKSLEQIMSL